VQGHSEDEDTFTLHVKASGGWTRRLHAYAEERKGQPTSILFEGPYGQPMVSNE
jgi:hypothetical protein